MDDPRASHHVGMVGEGHFIAYAAAQGWHLYRGLDGHTPCDYIADTGEGLKRVEVKRVEALQETCGAYYYVTVTKLDTNRFDLLFVSTPDGNYLIPVDQCPKNTLSIKQQQGPDAYKRDITRPGKYEAFRV